MKALYQPIPQEHFIPVFITLASTFVVGIFIVGCIISVVNGFGKPYKPKK